MKTLRLPLAIFVMLTMISCRHSDRKATINDMAGSSAQVYTSNYPLYFFAGKIGGDFLSVMKTNLEVLRELY